jgi:hypothetical protein
VLKAIEGDPGGKRYEHPTFDCDDVFGNVARLLSTPH